MDEEWTPPTGHNKPPLDLAAMLAPAALAVLLKTELALHQTRYNDLMAADARFSAAVQNGIPDDAMAGKATDFIRQLKAASKATDGARETIKAPVLAAQRQIDGAAKLIMAPLDAAATAAENRLKAYLRQKEVEARAAAEEEARKRGEEARRLIAEAEAAAAQIPASQADAEAQEAAEIVATGKAVAAIDVAQRAAQAAQAPAVDMSRTYTALGGVASLRQNWTYRVVDIMALLRAIVANQAPHHYVTEAAPILKALAKTQKDKATIPGVEFYNDAGVTIR